MKRYLLAIACLVLLQTSGGYAADVDNTGQPFFAKYCLRCHNAETQEAEFRLDTLSHDFSDMQSAQQWSEVLFRINAGEMPPQDEPQPTSAELGNVADWISSRIDEGRATRMARRGPISHYRLSRDEYANVVYDLLGVHFDPHMPGALLEDPRWHGFDRIGSVLSLSPTHVMRYLAAADSVVDRAFPRQIPKSSKQRQAANAPNRWLILPGWQQGNIRVRHAGLYRIRVHLSAVPSFQGRLPRLAIWNTTLKRAEMGSDVIASENEPKIVEIETFLPEGSFPLTNQAPGKLGDAHTLGATPRVVTRLEELSIEPRGYKLFTDDKLPQPVFPMLLVDWLEYEGPIVSEADRRKLEGLFPAGQISPVPSDPKQAEDLHAEARGCLKRLMTRAWRRPPIEAEVDRYVKILQSELAAGEDFRSAYMAAITGVLTSKNFYYIVEGSPSKRRDRVDDWELASRLSFFLWSSMPDEQLSAVARDGRLHKPEVLDAQLQRMLGDRKIERFVDTFPQQWLQLHRVGMFPPDSELYPDYDQWLEQSMVRETTGFFEEVFANNLSIRELLSSDWTVMNWRLAMHYGIDVPIRGGFHRIKLDPDDHRGGVLTHASVLSLTSDGTRHRPVHRGVWVSEAIFGRTPTPPPPNVEPLEPTPSDKPKATIRDQVEAHAAHATCASCHRKIDPLGFAFDNYDAIGRWRTTEKVAGGLGEAPSVDASGTLPDGRTYDGPREFRHLLASDIDRFAEAFVEQLATFALRRAMTIDDAPHITAIVQASKKDDYRLRTVIRELVMSDLFQMR